MLHGIVLLLVHLFIHAMPQVLWLAINLIVLPFMFLSAFVKFLWDFGSITARCPRCEERLRSNLAEQCVECGHDWHWELRRPGDKAIKEVF